MDSDEQPFSILSPYSPHPTNQNRMNTPQQPLRDHVLHPAPRQYTTVPEFQDNYGNEPQPSMLQNTSRYGESSRTMKEEQNTYIYTPPIEFRGEMNLNVHHHPTHPDHNTIRYPASHNPYSSDVNNSNTIRMASSPLESPEPRLASGPSETGSADFRYQIRALQPHQQHLLHPQRHQHAPLPHHQHQNHPLNHLQGGSAFYSPPINYSSQNQEHSSTPSLGGGLDQPQTQLSSLEYDSRESHGQHVPVTGMVYDSLAVPGHSQQGIVRRDATMNPHHSSLASINSSNSGSGGGSYHTANSPVSSIPMSNSHGTASSMNASVLGAHISSSFSIGPSSNSRWAGHPSGFDMPGSSAAHSQVPSTPASSASPSSSLIRPTLRHAAESDSRSTPENSFSQDNNNNFHLRLRTSTSAQTLSSSYSHTNSPSPRLSDNESTSPGGGGRHLRGDVFNNNRDDRESDEDAETVIQMSEQSSAPGRKGVVVIRAGEEVKKEVLTSPVKKKKKSKMHCCEVCSKKFPRPSGLKTHMNTHSNEKPFPCGFPGCTRSFGVRSNAKRHLRTHGVIPTSATNSNSSDAPYVVDFCQPMIGVPQSSSSHHHQLHSIEGGGGGNDFPSPPGGSRLPGDHSANIHHTQDHQGQSDVQHEVMGSAVPTLKLRWMPPSLTTRTNAGSLREVVDEQHQQMQHWMGDVVEEEEEDGEDEDDFAANISHVRHTSRGGYDMEMDQDDMIEDGGDKAEYGGENVPRLRSSIPLRPNVIPSSSSTSAAIAASSSIGIPSRLTVSTQGTCRPSSSSSSRMITSSISPSSTTSFARSNSSLSPPSNISGYGQQHEIDHIATNVGGGSGGCDVLYTTTRTDNISREYGV